MKLLISTFIPSVWKQTHTRDSRRPNHHYIHLNLIIKVYEGFLRLPVKLASLSVEGAEEDTEETNALIQILIKGRKQHKDGTLFCVWLRSHNYMTIIGLLWHRQQLCSQTQTLQQSVLLHEWKPQLVFCNVFLSQQQPQEVTINNKPIKIKVSVLLFRLCNTVGQTRLTGGSWAVQIYTFHCKK